MSVTCGFYNSLNYDRGYDAVQVSSLFDGLIIDGVFASIGTCFVVTADTGINVNVGIGKAWFNRTWTLNDSILAMEAPLSEVLLDRIDAIVLEVNASEEVRENTIKFVKGTPSSSPVNPTLISEANVHQYPLCYITRPAGSTTITQAQITNTVGSEATPFITGILQTISLNELLGQWEAELDQFITDEQTDFLNWFNQMREDLLAEQAILDQWVADEQANFTNWMNEEKDEYEAWLESITNTLDDNVAGNLLNLITDLDTSKADKTVPAKPGNLAGLDSDGNLIDIGKSVLDFQANKNLLTNWYFSNPKNTLNRTTYTTDGITIDNWTSYLLNVTLTSNGLSLSTRTGTDAQMKQRIVGLDTSLTYTFSWIGNDELYSITTIPGSGIWTKTIPNTAYYSLAKWDNDIGVVISLSQGKTMTVSAAKLELGTESTLAHKDANGDLGTIQGVDLSTALLKTGGTMTGALNFTSGVGYGTTLPSTGLTAGRIFFLKV